MFNGESHVVEAQAVEGSPSQDFSAPGVEAAVRAIQANRIPYKE